MKKLILLIASVAVCSGAFAQKKEQNLLMANKKFVETVDSTVVVKEGSGLIINKFWDNWFISLNGGGQVYFGDYDNHVKLGDRITLTGAIAAGKWFTPIFGLRGQFGYSHNMVGQSKSANVFTTGSFKDGYIKQEWSQLYANVNVMLNLSNAIGGYRSDRFYSIVPYVGGGAVMALDMPDSRKDRSLGVNMGIINNFRLSNTFDINVELMNMMVDNDYDQESVGSSYESFASATIGLTWKIGGAKHQTFHAAENTKTYVSRNYIPEVQVVKEVVVQEKEVRVPVGGKLAPMTMFFEFGESKVTPRSEVTLEAAAEAIKAGEGKFRVTGMADSKTGSAKVNKKLSESRANAVRDVLVKKFGVPADKLIVEGIGGVDYKNPNYVNRAVVIAPEK